MYGYSEEEYRELSDLYMVLNNLQDAQTHLNLTKQYIGRVNDGTFSDRLGRIAKNLDQLLMDIGEVILTKESKE